MVSSSKHSTGLMSNGTEEVVTMKWSFRPGSQNSRDFESKHSLHCQCSPVGQKSVILVANFQTSRVETKGFLYFTRLSLVREYANCCHFLLSNGDKRMETVRAMVLCATSLTYLPLSIVDCRSKKRDSV